MRGYSILDIDEIIERENEAIEAQYGKTGKVYAATEDYGSLSGEEVQMINLRIGQIAENEDVFAVLWSARRAIYEVVRAVKAKLKSTEAVFMGEFAEGKQLDIEPVMPADVKKGGTPLTDWLQTVTAGEAYFESDSGDGKITLPDWEGRVYLGWIDTIDSPKLVSVMYELSMRNVMVKTPFEMCKEFPLIRHRAIKLIPADSYRIKVKYKGDGDDMARPLAVKVITAEKKTL